MISSYSSGVRGTMLMREFRRSKQSVRNVDDEPRRVGFVTFCVVVLVAGFELEGIGVRFANHFGDSGSVRGFALRVIDDDAVAHSRVQKIVLGLMVSNALILKPTAGPVLLELIEAVDGGFALVQPESHDCSIARSPPAVLR
jgi:hypothetical protein